jgi:hypothetical protein
MGYVKDYQTRLGTNYLGSTPGQPALPGGISGTTSPGALGVTQPGKGGQIGQMYTAHCVYNFAVDGGAVGLITPVLSPWIPAYAILSGGIINVPTAVTSGGSATIALGFSGTLVGGTAASCVLTATGKASFTIDALIATALSASAAVKTSSAGQLTLTVAVAALTAGLIEVFVDFKLPFNA